MPSHLVSAESGFPQGAAQNGQSVQATLTEQSPNTTDYDNAEPETSASPQLPEQSQPAIEGMTREEGDGEGEKDLSSESQ